MQNLIINAIDELRATNIRPVTIAQIKNHIKDKTQKPIDENNFFEEIEFLRGRRIIAEMGMGGGDDRLFYK